MVDDQLSKTGGQKGVGIYGEKHHKTAEEKRQHG